MPYSFIRTMNWIFDLACSSIGIAVFITLCGWLFQPKSFSSILTEEEQKRRQIQNDKRQATMRLFSAITLIGLLIIAVIKYSGFVSIEDVFNGQYKYVGQTLNPKADGYGRKYTVNDSLIYEGDFSINMYDGSGKYYAILDISGEEVSRLRYEGEFKSGLFHGTGKKYYAAVEDVNEDGKEAPYLLYDGEFRNGVFEGHGIRFYTSKRPNVENAETVDDYYIAAIYDGEWSGGNRSGKGVHTLYDPNEIAIERYTGDFSNDAYNGVGIWEFTDKSDGEYGQVIYHGSVVNGRCTGDGVYYDRDGTVISVHDESGKGRDDLISVYPFPAENIWNEK